MSRVYDFSSSNRTKMPFKDLQGVLNENSVIQQTISSYSVLIDLARVELVTISYSKEIFEISYFASGTFGDDTADFMTWF